MQESLYQSKKTTLVNNLDAEKQAAKRELAEFCGLTVEEMFGEEPKPVKWVDPLFSGSRMSDFEYDFRLLVQECKTVSSRDTFGFNPAIAVNQDRLLEVFKIPELVGLEKYGLDAVIMPGEVGRFYGVRVFLDDRVNNELGAMIRFIPPNIKARAMSESTPPDLSCVVSWSNDV